jgi:hypothetical protein
MLARVPWIDLMFIAGFVLLTWGVREIYGPAALILDGLLLVVCAVLVRFGTR